PEGSVHSMMSINSPRSLSSRLMRASGEMCRSYSDTRARDLQRGSVSRRQGRNPEEDRSHAKTQRPQRRHKKRRKRKDGQDPAYFAFVSCLLLSCLAPLRLCVRSVFFWVSSQSVNILTLVRFPFSAGISPWLCTTIAKISFRFECRIWS